MKLVAAIVMILISAYSHAEINAAIALNPFEGEKSLHVTNVMNFYGKCGGTVVAVLGVQADDFDNQGNFKIDTAGNAEIQLRAGGKDISFHNILSDFNVVQCVNSKSGIRLLVGSHCGGSQCTDSYDFYIIDPKNGAMLPKKGAKEACDAKCASEILGNSIPMGLQ